MTRKHSSTEYRDELYRSIIVGNLPLIDVRAPLEFESGSLPGAINMPILDNDERHQVGLRYRQQGKQAAIELGMKLVAGELRLRRIAAWKERINQYPKTFIYCARGGLRSLIARNWLDEHDQRVNVIPGGYKAFRQFLLGSLHPRLLTSQPIVIGGRTGVGKTVLIKRFRNSIDLEALANHRGSAFGQNISEQPSQADFENRLASVLLRHQHSNHRAILVEDEGRHVGKRFLPRELSHYFGCGKLVIVEASLEQRVERTFYEYVVSGQHRFQEKYGDEAGVAEWIAQMKAGMAKIDKRLGSHQSQTIRGILESAWQEQSRGLGLSSYRDWIKQLLRGYYDPMYDFQLESDTRKLIFQGDIKEVEQYLRTMKLGIGSEPNEI